MLVLLKDINRRTETPLDESQVERIYEAMWQHVDREYNEALANVGTAAATPPRDAGAMLETLEEILARIRDLEFRSYEELRRTLDEVLNRILEVEQKGSERDQRLLEHVLHSMQLLEARLREGVGRRVARSVARAVLSDTGVTAETPDAVKIAYVYENHEYLSEIRKPGTDWRLIIDNLLSTIRIPISEVRVYRGSELVYRLPLSDVLWSL